MKTFLAGLFLIYFLSPSGAFAEDYRNSWDSLRCGSALISIGDAREVVLEKCGPPASKKERVQEIFKCKTYKKVQPNKSKGSEESDKKPKRVCSTWERIVIDFEDWTYDLGPTQFLRFLLFSDGKLFRIETGEYGKTR